MTANQKPSATSWHDGKFVDGEGSLSQNLKRTKELPFPEGSGFDLAVISLPD